jgi:hypothetical protein
MEQSDVSQMMWGLLESSDLSFGGVLETPNIDCAATRRVEEPVDRPGVNKTLFQFRPQSKAVRMQMEAAGYRPKYEMLVPNSWRLQKVVDKLTTKWSRIGTRLRLRPQTDPGASAWSDADYSLTVGDTSVKVSSENNAVVLVYSWAETSAGRKRGRAVHLEAGTVAVQKPSSPVLSPEPSPGQEPDVASPSSTEVLHEGALGDATCMGLLSVLTPPPENTVHVLVPKKKVRSEPEATVHVLVPKKKARSEPDARGAISVSSPELVLPAVVSPPTSASVHVTSASRSQSRIKKRIAPTLVTALNPSYT